MRAKRKIVATNIALTVPEPGELPARLTIQHGYGITLEPGYWRDGAVAIEQLDALVPPDRHLPQPARGLSDPELLSFPRRWWTALRVALGTTWLQWAFLVLLVVVAVAGLVTGRLIVTIAMSVGAYSVYKSLREEQGPGS
ncbi:MAG: hypothetical protein Q8O61_16260 [Nocardioides sp.]|nr:hypothetical protein [Nocardioides sp.]